MSTRASLVKVTSPHHPGAIVVDGMTGLVDRSTVGPPPPWAALVALVAFAPPYPPYAILVGHDGAVLPYYLPVRLG